MDHRAPAPAPTRRRSAHAPLLLALALALLGGGCTGGVQGTPGAAGLRDPYYPGLGNGGYSGSPETITGPDGSKEGWLRTADGAVALGEPAGSTGGGSRPPVEG